MKPHNRKQIIIVGGGFAGIELIKRLDKNYFDILLIDKNNYHQFQPLLYQVASSGLDASSICFPFRKIINKFPHVQFKYATVTTIHPDSKTIDTTIGSFAYDYLVVAAGTTTNFFGNANIARSALPMKSVEEAIWLRNKILLQMEEAALSISNQDRERLLTLVVVGGGATGVEVAGVLSEIKRFVVPKEYPELQQQQLRIVLVEAESRVLSAMSAQASEAALRSLQAMGVEVMLHKRVKEYLDEMVILDDGTTIPSKTLIWVSGIVANTFQGIPAEAQGRSKRLLVNRKLQVKGVSNLFAVGDIALVEGDTLYPNGHPQVAQVAIQQAHYLAYLLKLESRGEEIAPFRYKNLGSMATIGRNKAVADVWGVHLTGFVAWVIWLVVHLRSILGVKNKILVLLDWMWNYFNYHRSTRLLIFKGRRE